MTEPIYITMTINLEEVDTILASLKEKELMIQELEKKIFEETNFQISLRTKEKKMMENIKIICKDCGKEFDFTPGEQRFYESKGFAAPIRCQDCRNKKKERNENNPKVEEKEEKKNDLEAMLKKFKENTVIFEKERK